jgi:hypothetical protein
MKTYDAGCCCQSTVVKTIPLDKIQDLNLVADCCGDCCGFVTEKGSPYKLVVQTAGSSDDGPELTIVCIENIAKFRKKVFAAKKALASSAAVDGGVSGAAKAAVSGEASGSAEKFAAGVHGADGGHVARSAEAARMLATLERIERLVENGVLELRATRTAK